MRFAVLLLGAVAPLLAQSYPHHNITLGMGGASPGADLAGFFSGSFGMGANYGYRFHRLFQADLGFETLFGAARVKDFYETDFGPLRIKDYQYFVPMGGRALVPLGRVLISAGGGGAYMKYSERIRQPSDFYRIACPVCQSRSGWGYYGLLGFSVALDRRHMFRLGVTTRVYRGHTDGEPLGSVPGIRTRDMWVNTLGEFGLSF